MEYLTHQVRKRVGRWSNKRRFERHFGLYWACPLTPAGWAILIVITRPRAASGRLTRAPEVKATRDRTDLLQRRRIKSPLSSQHMPGAGLYWLICCGIADYQGRERRDLSVRHTVK